MSVSQKPKMNRVVSRQLLLAFAIVAAVTIFVCVRQSSHTRVLGSPWEENGLLPIEHFDHSDFDALLNEYVNEQGRVDYRRWHDSEDDLLQLRSYLQSTSRVHWNADRSPHTSVANPKDHELAFWINVYNALTIQAILDVWPTDSVRQNTNPLGYDLWSHYKLIVGSRAYSLTEMENGPLSLLNEPRLHFALTRGSVSCPQLQPAAFQADQIEDQLNASVKRFFANPANVHLEGTSRVHLNPVTRIALQSATDDTRKHGFLLSKWVNDPPVSAALNSPDTQWLWMKHDWSLNHQ